MLDSEFYKLLKQIESKEYEGKTLEIKSANRECPESLYDTFSSFSNQDEGGIIVFGIDKTQGFKRTGVYDAQDLQKKLTEIGGMMTPNVRPVLSVFDIDGLVFVTAEIPPKETEERPCFKTAKGRLRGSYIRIGDADKPMTEYEVYGYETFRKKIRDDVRPVEDCDAEALDRIALEEYLLKRKMERPNLAALPEEQLYELTGITKNGHITLSAVMLFSLYPQAYFPRLCVIASSVRGNEAGVVDDKGQRFTFSKCIEGTIPEMLDNAVGFVNNNMHNAVKIDPKTGIREDIPEYPLDAVREAILNALIHRDYIMYTENMPIRLTLFRNRLEIKNPGGLYGRLSVDQLGKTQPDTRNPFLVTAMESLGKAENRYSGIPRIRQAMQDLKLPPPDFRDCRGEFSVCLYNNIQPTQDMKAETEIHAADIDEKGLLSFCLSPRNRKEIYDYLGFSNTQYAIKRYLDPLVEIGAIRLSIPEHPRSKNQIYTTNSGVLKK